MLFTGRIGIWFDKKLYFPYDINDKQYFISLMVISICYFHRYRIVFHLLTYLSIGHGFINISYWYRQRFAYQLFKIIESDFRQIFGIPSIYLKSLFERLLQNFILKYHWFLKWILFFLWLCQTIKAPGLLFLFGLDLLLKSELTIQIYAAIYIYGLWVF